jgi:UDP-N-acetylglucosamine 2-epimerase (non-hydrolysing)
MKKIDLIVGARPNFMKIAPLYREFKKYPQEFAVRLIHTGQHYDQKMSDFFFNDLQLPVPDEYLGVGSGSHGEQTGKVMIEYERILLKDRPDLVIVVGDVNSTVACAIDAVKLHIPVAHLEAGLRSFDRAMPEEINRLLTDAISEYLLTPSQDADQNLINEGVGPDKIYFVGNIMIDSLIDYRQKAEESLILEKLELTPDEYALVTLHRPSNVDTPEGLATILNALAKISEETTVVFPVHPRTRKNISEFGLQHVTETNPNMTLIDPLGYYDFMKLQMKACLILTDSGGIQEESTYFGVPCLTLRPNTERPVTITEGTNRLVKLETDEIVRSALDIVRGSSKQQQRKIPNLWDGKTAERVVDIFRKRL